MSGLFDGPDDTDGPRDRMRSAERARPLPKRFYETVDYALTEDGESFVVRLDGKPVRTPAKAYLAVSQQPIAAVLVEEWEAQKDFINPATMPMTRLVNSAIDGVARVPHEVKAEIVRYAGNDLLCYRAANPDRLPQLQDMAWSPLVRWMDERFGARFVLTEGVVHVEQFPEALEAVERAIGNPDPVSLAALSTVNALTGSAILALAVAYGRLSAEEAWAAAHVDEDFQISLWGGDDEAEARRAARWQDMRTAGLVLAAVGSSPFESIAV